MIDANAKNQGPGVLVQDTRIPPQNIEAEQVILGSCLLSERATIEAVDKLSADDFYRNSHKVIFGAISDLFSIGVNPDLVTVAEKLKNDSNFEASGGPVYLAGLTDCIPGNVAQYCSIVKSAAVKRSVIDSFSGIIEQAYNGAETESLLDTINSSVLGITSGRASGPVHVAEIAKQAMDEIQTQLHRKDPVYGISTGLADLDSKTGGLHRGEYTVVAGRPGTGKTSLALKFANEAAAQNEGVLFFSLEMKSIRLVKRILAAGAGVSGTKIKTGYLGSSDFDNLQKYANLLSSRSVFIDDTPGLTIAELTSRAKRIALQHSISMIVVDYVQLSRAPGVNNRALELANISAGLLGLAKDLNVSMVVLSQLNRNVESRIDKRPMISDLKESGALEQDADIILLLYRDELYNDDSPHAGIAEIIIGKGRDIGNWTVKTGFNGEKTEFYNLAQVRLTSLPSRYLTAPL